jgi:hypothetical protein
LSESRFTCFPYSEEPSAVVQGDSLEMVWESCIV